MNDVLRKPDDDEEDDCGCLCHDENARREFRLMEGTDIEGVSIREVVYDDKDIARCWTDPLGAPAGSTEEVRDEILMQIGYLFALSEAFAKPVLREAELEPNLSD